MKRILGLTCLLLFIPRWEGDETTWEHLVESYDTNGDGRIDCGELLRDSEQWKRFDRDGDGVLTRDEVARWLRDAP